MSERDSLSFFFPFLFFFLSFDKDFNEQSHVSNSFTPEGVGGVCVLERAGVEGEGDAECPFRPGKEGNCLAAPVCLCFPAAQLRPTAESGAELKK